MNNAQISSHQMLIRPVFFIAIFSLRFLSFKTLPSLVYGCHIYGTRSFSSYMSYIEEADRLARSFYEVLGVEKDASIQEIKKAYREKLLSTHPDKINGKVVANNSTRTTSKDDINSIQVAFKVLTDEVLRKKYDESLLKSVQRAGFNISGEGLDSYSLDEFELNEEELKYYKNCPRCQFPKSIQVSEADLEHGTADGTGGYNLIVQCDSCSLWLIVNYYEGESEDDS